jgi:hypothetical protein
MMPGHHQDMTGVDRLVVHECNDLGILIDHAPLQLATDESAERATVIDLDRHNHSLSAQYWSLLEVPRFHWSVGLRAVEVEPSQGLTCQSRSPNPRSRDLR